MTGTEHIDPREILAALAAGDRLDEHGARAVFESVLTGAWDEAQTASLLTALRLRGVTVAELTGAARAMRAHVTPVPFEPGEHDRLVDTCGTGGAPKTFNVSTTAALIAAAAEPSKTTGVQRVLVAKHGNRSRTGRGSAEVLSRLGINVDASPETQARCLREAGVCFCFAIHHHPAMRHAAGPRRSLAFATIFNLLGPLTNPAGATRQLLGVYDRPLVELVAGALAGLGCACGLVVHGRDGLDEITTTDATDAARVKGGDITPMPIDPLTCGLARSRFEDLQVSTVEDSAGVIRAILRGDPGPRRDITLINAGATLLVAGACESLEEGVTLAAGAIDSGSAAARLESLARLSREDA